MKRLILFISFLACLAINASAQAEIKFDKTIHNFGSFPESESIHKATFTFTNVGNKPLVINQAIASCGCTIPKYTKTPIAPGHKGEISVTFKYTPNMWPGHFKKTVTIRSNASVEMVRLYIEGTVVEEKKK